MKLQRYTFGVLQPDPDSERGEWVRLEDVQRLVEACREWLNHYDNCVRDPLIGDEPGIAEMREAIAETTKGTP